VKTFAKTVILQFAVPAMAMCNVLKRFFMLCGTVTLKLAKNTSQMRIGLISQRMNFGAYTLAVLKTQQIW
jgi:hypothetical protein